MKSGVTTKMQDVMVDFFVQRMPLLPVPDRGGQDIRRNSERALHPAVEHFLGALLILRNCVPMRVPSVCQEDGCIWMEDLSASYPLFTRVRERQFYLQENSWVSDVGTWNMDFFRVPCPPRGKAERVGDNESRRMS
jgi:hypothetical protein